MRFPQITAEHVCLHLNVIFCKYILQNKINSYTKIMTLNLHSSSSEKPSYNFVFHENSTVLSSLQVLTLNCWSFWGHSSNILKKKNEEHIGYWLERSAIGVIHTRVFPLYLNFLSSNILKLETFNGWSGWEHKYRGNKVCKRHKTNKKKFTTSKFYHPQ